MKGTVLITGGTSGLGRALVSKFTKEEYKIFHHNGRDHYNLSDPEQVKQLAKNAKDAGVNILVNNAAVVCPNKNFSEYSPEEITFMIDVNLKAPILLTHYLQDNLTDIININSMVGLEIKSPRTLYSATKWGLRGFAESLKQELDQILQNRQRDHRGQYINILDIYPTNIKTTPERENAMDLDFVVNSIYNSFIYQKRKLILDGRL